MRRTKPKFKHAPEVYHAIIAEHRHSEVRMAERLQACGWTLADAAWAAVNWDLRTMAAAIANERDAHKAKLTHLSDGDLAKLRVEIASAHKPSQMRGHRKTTRIMRATPKLPRPPEGADASKA